VSSWQNCVYSNPFLQWFVKCIKYHSECCWCWLYSLLLVQSI
jgi:hypothetical protein